MTRAKPRPARGEPGEVEERDEPLPLQVDLAPIPLRAAVRCPCGRHCVQAAADALAELDAPCPDCRATEGRRLIRFGGRR